MGITKRVSDRMSTISTTTTATVTTTSSSHHSHNTSNASRNSLNNSLQSSTSVSTVGESIPHDQRPRLITPALKTPTWPDGNGVLSMVAATRICAPLTSVALLLLDARTYPKWNAFCPGVTVTSQPKSTAPLPACLASDPVLGAIANNHTTLRDGTAFIMEVCMDPSDQSGKKTTPRLQVSSLEQFEREDGRVGVRLAWRIKGKMANLLVRSERVQEFVSGAAADGKPCVEYVCWETYYGMLASSMKVYYGKQLEAGYTAWMDGLKSYAEQRTRGNPDIADKKEES